MSSFLPLKLREHRASLAAKVLDAVTARPVASVKARITSGPPAFARWLEAQDKQAEARSAADGCLGFIDLPDGDYTVAFAAPGYGALTRVFKVSESAPSPLAIASIALPPTGIRGVVLSGQTPLPLARVRFLDLGESAYCGAAGDFYLGGLQAGTRRLAFSAQGYVPLTMTAAIVEGQVLDLGTVSLNPAGT